MGETEILDKEVYWTNLVEQVRALKRETTVEFPTEAQWADIVDKVAALEDAGVAGPKGDKGDTGEQGPAGTPGTNGTNGADGFGTEAQYNDIISRLVALENPA